MGPLQGEALNQSVILKLLPRNNLGGGVGWKLVGTGREKSKFPGCTLTGRHGRSAVGLGESVC